MAEGKPPEKVMTQKRVLAIVIAIVVVGSAGTVIWYMFYKSWDIKDVAAAIADTPDAPGFRHSLAGRTIVVEGRVTGISSNMTTQGMLSMVELDNFDYLHLAIWGDVPYSIGQEVRKEVRFEWSICNSERHVYSPQLDFPNLFALPSIEVLMKAVALVAGYDLYPSMLPDGRINVSVLWADRPTALSSYNCSLRSGVSSFTNEYIQSLQPEGYGQEMDRLQPLEPGSGSRGNLTYVDGNSNGILDRGDWFVLSGLRKPSTESGFQTYLLDLSTREMSQENLPYDHHLPAYIVFNKYGLLRYTTNVTPYCYLNGTTSDSEISLSVTYITDPISWNLTSVYLQGYGSRAEWTPPAGSLTGIGPVTADLGIMELGNVSVRCLVTDLAGNGVVDAGDTFRLVSQNGTFVASHPTSVWLMELVYHSWFGGFHYP
jgi:hypothetical protein